MVNLCHRLCRLFGQLQDGSGNEVKELTHCLKNLIPLSEEAIDLRIKIELLERRIHQLEGKKKPVPGVY